MESFVSAYFAIFSKILIFYHVNVNKCTIVNKLITEKILKKIFNRKKLFFQIWVFSVFSFLEDFFSDFFFTFSQISVKYL